jgi:hypothetical protein
MDGLPIMRTFTREIWHNYDKVFARGMLILFAATLLFYIGLIIFALGSGCYSFVHDDEFNYVAAAKLFSETGSVRAPLCMMEEVSKIFGANWYGILYNIFYGTIYFIFGQHSIIFILVNIIFIFLFSVLIIKSNVNSYNNIFALELLLLSYPVLVYTFMFFPEILQLFLALIQFMILFKIYQVHLSGGNYRKIIFLFVAVSIAFSLFRVTSVFWIAGIIPFCKNKKQFFSLLLVFAVSVFIVMAYMHYFIAPAFVWAMSSIDALKSFQFTSFFSTWTKYIGYNFSTLFTFTIKEPQVLILFLLFAFAVYRSFYKNQKIFLAAVLISLCYFFALLSFYNTYSFYFTKQTAVLFPLLICPLAFISSLKIRKIALLCFIVAFPFYISTATTEISLRKKAGNELKYTYDKQVAELKKISGLVDQNNCNLIEFIHYEHKFPRYIFYEALPLSNGNNFPVTYTASVYNESLYPKMEYSKRFPRYWKQNVDYIISRDSLNLPDIEMIYHSPYYFLYKDNR